MHTRSPAVADHTRTRRRVHNVCCPGEPQHTFNGLLCAVSLHLSKVCCFSFRAPLARVQADQRNDMKAGWVIRWFLGKGSSRTPISAVLKPPLADLSSHHARHHPAPCHCCQQARTRCREGTRVVAEGNHQDRSHCSWWQAGGGAWRAGVGAAEQVASAHG